MADHPLLDAARDHRLITKKQHAHVLEELENFPGQEVEDLLLRKHFLTPAQLSKLKSLPPAESSPPPAAAEPSAAEPPAAAAAAAAPAASPARSAPAAAAAPSPARPAAAPSAPPPAPASGGSGVVPMPMGPDGRIDAAQLKGLAKLLYLARSWNCSDLHVSVGKPPFVRLNGGIRYLETEPLTPERTEKLIFALLTEEQRTQARKLLTLDFSLELQGLGRHRCNLFHQRLGWDASFRIVPAQVPTMESLGLPTVIKSLCDFHQGLLLVTGPGGSGKTTTIASMLDYVNSQREEHIITVEDPIEYVQVPRRCQITQREVGPHTQSFGNALRAALREDPDIILVGELRDLETIQIAISAAETGHLVFGSLHTGSAARTVSRIVDTYPAKQRAQIRLMISESLRGVISQQLLPRRDGSGRVAALEILVVTSGVSALIKEDKSHLMASAMQSGRKSGMRTMDDSIMELASSGIISGRTAYEHAENKQLFELNKDQD